MPHAGGMFSSTAVVRVVPSWIRVSLLLDCELLSCVVRLSMWCVPKRMDGRPQGGIRIAVHHRRRGTPLPLQTKVSIVGKNEIYKRENLVGPFLVHKILGPRRPPPPLLILPKPAPRPRQEIGGVPLSALRRLWGRAGRQSLCLLSSQLVLKVHRGLIEVLDVDVAMANPSVLDAGLSAVAWGEGGGWLSYGSPVV